MLLALTSRNNSQAKESICIMLFESGTALVLHYNQRAFFVKCAFEQENYFAARVHELLGDSSPSLTTKEGFVMWSLKHYIIQHFTPNQTTKTQRD